MEKPDVCKFERGLKEALPYLPNNQFQTRNPVKLMTFFLFFLFFFFLIYSTQIHTLYILSLLVYCFEVFRDLLGMLSLFQW